ncbi:polysulfide reductase [Leekyejoonella antrihumi]|uniref:Polysulfide reductase n=2 Tax=Leekyejoonella antrihumi TaxID=1660198 RepID=A0A563E2C7_9MICO|nr:polysulfide reductase [Leekyejoonella antrihumi]
MVPEAEFTSYYGRPVVKESPWQADIPAYLFTGGLAGASSLLAAGAGATGRSTLARNSRVGALAAIGASTFFLIHDLGKPSRFLNMMRVFRPTSPMSMGTWLLAAYGPLTGLAAAHEIVGALPVGTRKVLPSVFTRALQATGRPAGWGAALVGPAVATYTAVLIGDTATPTWHDASGQLPFVFAGSAATAAGGLGMLTTPVPQSGPARRMAVGGVIAEQLAQAWMTRSMGLSVQTLHEDRAGTLLRLATVLSTAGGIGVVLAGAVSRKPRGATGAQLLSAVSGTALMAASACTRFGIFHAGQASARDPRYTVVPQRERVDAGHPVRSDRTPPGGG